jgi:hypothetical protein
MTRLVARVALALFGLTLAGHVLAKSSQIVLYEDDNFRGNDYMSTDSIQDLEGTGFNERASSIDVRSGRWLVCSEAFFRGTCVTLGPGRYPSLRPMGLNDRVSSARSLGWTPDGGGGWNGESSSDGNHWGHRDGRWGAGSRAVLYENEGLNGLAVPLSDDSVRNLKSLGFNDRASSLRVESGYWLFCRDADFGGECRTFGPGDYPRLPGGLGDRISSGRRISNDYPYQQRPNWGGGRADKGSGGGETLRVQGTRRDGGDGKLTVHSTPSRTSRGVASLAENQQVRSIGCERRDGERWCRVELSGSPTVTGWVLGDYVR